jgi:hypothetical protein
MNRVIKTKHKLFISGLFETNNEIGVSQKGMDLIILMFQLDKSGLRVRNGDFLEANVPINRVDDLGIIVEREDLVGFVETVDKSNFLLICHLR